MSTSISKISLRTALISTLLILFLLIAIFSFYQIEINWGLILLFTALYLGLMFIFINYTITQFVSDKIKPIYKTLYSSHKTDKNAFISTSKNDDLVNDVNNQVIQWEKSKIQEIEKLKQLEEYRKEFLGNVSHELKTPIFNIQGYILTLLDGGLEDPTINKKYLIRTEKSIDRLINIVKDLEAISKLETGSLELEITDFNIVNLTREIIDSLETRASVKEIKLIFNKNYERPIMVEGDKSRINQVITNLLLNSINYGKDKGSTLISFHDVDDKILVEINDNGIGIEKKDLSRIFERFYRADKSRSREQGGTGLGLSIVKHIIDAHDQAINVSSEIGKGTTFTFTLNKTSL